jgi:leucyl aminopeptidase
MRACSVLGLLALPLTIQTTTAQVGSSSGLPLSKDSLITSLVARVSEPSVSWTINGLQSFGSRFCENSNLTAIVGWLEEKFYSTGVATVYVDSFYYSGLLERNVIAVIPGDSLPQKEIVIGAHYDSYSSNLAAAPGADDNASGVSAVLEMLRVLESAGYRPTVTLKFIAFAAEEVGLKGSFDYAGKAKERGDDIVLMHNFDMISYRNRISPSWNMSLIWYTGCEDVAALDSAAMTTYTRLHPVRSTSQRTRSDSYPFYFNDFNVIYSAAFDLNPYYHTPKDLLDSMDVSYAAEIIRAGLALVLTVERSYSQSPPLVPVTARVYQNYPNPFNPETVIRYDLPEPGHVTLTVYDALGREVERLFDGTRDAGTYRARWNAAGRASGVYFCRLRLDGSSQSIKMMVVR